MHVKTTSFIPNTSTSQTPYRMGCMVTHLIQACQTQCKSAVVPVHVIKACRGVQVQLPSFLTLALDGGEWSNSRSGLLNPHPRERNRYPFNRTLDGPQNKFRSGRFEQTHSTKQYIHILIHPCRLTRYSFIIFGNVISIQNIMWSLSHIRC